MDRKRHRLTKAATFASGANHTYERPGNRDRGSRDVVSITHVQPGKFEYSSATTEVEAFAGCTPSSQTAGTCDGPVAAVLAYGQSGSDDITLSLCALGNGTGCASVVPGGFNGGSGDDTLIGNVVRRMRRATLRIRVTGADRRTDTITRRLQLKR